MALAPLVATQLTTPVSRTLSLFIGGRYIVPKWDSVQITDGKQARGRASVRIESALSDYPEITDQAMVRLVDHVADDEAYRGYVAFRRPGTVPGHSSIDINSVDIGSLLDSTFIPHEWRPEEDVKSRCSYLWGKYAGSHLSGDMSHVKAISGILPNQTFTAVTLRQALSAIMGQVGLGADFYVDMLGKLHVFKSEDNPAPYAVDAVAAGAGSNFPISAHRGDIGSADSYPENTLEAAVQALNKGADEIEIDVQRSSDSTWYLMHDESVDRTTDGTGNINSLTDAQIGALAIDAGYGYNSGRHGSNLVVPTLTSVLSALDASPYRSAVQALAPVAYWRLGEASGTSAADASGNGEVGTYVGSPTLGAGGLLTDDANTAVTFPGADTDYMQGPALADLGTAFCLAAWITPTVDDSGIFISGGGSRPYLRHLNSDITMAFTDSGASQVTFSTPADDAPVGVPIFVVGTHDGTTARIYINGVERATDSTASQATGALSFRVGRWGAGGLPFDGTVDEAAIFDRALTADEVAALYVQGSAPTAQPADIMINFDLKDSADADHTALANYIIANWYPSLAIVNCKSLSGAAAVKAVSATITTITQTGVTDQPQTEANVDEWLAVRTEVTSATDVTSRSPAEIEVYVGVEDFGLSERQWLRDAFGYGVHRFMTNNLDVALEEREAIASTSIAPEDLSIEWDSSGAYANAVYVQGATPEGSGLFLDHEAIADANGLVRTATLNAPDCDTAAMATSLANMYLGRVSIPNPRGSFTTGSPNDGWRASQNLSVTSADFGLAGEIYSIARVTTKIRRPGSSPLRGYTVEFGAARVGASDEV